MLSAALCDRIQPEPNTGCWLWTGACISQGYGALMVRKEFWLAHRYVYTQRMGPIPAGHELHHVCGVRSCVNPDHLRAVTRREHPGNLAAINAAKTCCSRCGGPYYTNCRGQRVCRRCGNARACIYQRAYRARTLEKQNA